MNTKLAKKIYTYTVMILSVLTVLIVLAGPSSGSSEKQLKEFIESGWDFCIGAFDCET